MTHGDIQNLLATALAHHQAGRLAQAEPVYRQILAADPNQPDALHLLGVLWHQVGRSAQALDLVAKAVSMAPTFSNLNNLGEVFRALGRAADAIACYRKSIQLSPNSPDAYGNLGLLLLDLNQFDQAEKNLARAAQLAPGRADLQVRLCLARHKQGDPHGAVQAGKRAIELAPQLPEAWSNLAVALASAKRHDEAIAAAKRSIELAPNRAEAWCNLGLVHERAGRDDDALAAYRRAIAINPSFSTAHRNLAAFLDARGRVEESIASLQRALELQPRDLEGWNNLSALRRRNRDNQGALAAAQQALALVPGNPEAHGNLGLALLALGDYDRGFAEYEWRWRCSNFTTEPREFDRPMWDGSDPAGRTIFIHTEQGFGDTIQFVRYVPMLAARGAKIFLESSLPLRPVLASLAGVSRVIPAGVRPPDFDLHVPLLSLPKIFRTTLATIPNQVPYLSADPGRLESWKQRIDAAAPHARLKLGLIWAGNAKPDPARTCPLANLAPLADVEGVALFSLQKRDEKGDASILSRDGKGDASLFLDPARLSNAPAAMKLIDLGPDLKDFSDTAAAMQNLDLILTIDTAAAHLAGALGRKTWVLLPWAADWRWLEHREDSPWYPTMRLFRQPIRGDWSSVVQRVVEQLRDEIAVCAER